MQRKTSQQFIFLPAVQPQTFLVPKISNFPLVISIRGSSWPVHSFILFRSLLFCSVHINRGWLLTGQASPSPSQIANLIWDPAAWPLPPVTVGPAH